MITKRWFALLLIAFLVIGCNDDANESDSSTSTPVSDVTPAAGATSTGSDRPVYIALGDSLSQGIGASDMAATAFVPLVATYLDEYELLNLGHGGDTSADLIDHGHLDEAIDKIELLKDSETGRVRLVTLEIGGNDLLRIYFSLVQTGDCPDLETALAEQRCVDALRSALDGFVPNLETTFDRLHDADPELPVLLLTLYNPFQHFPGVGELGVLSLEGMPDTPFPEGMNDLSREAAAGRDNVTVVDVYELFQGRSQELIAGDLIHPNDAGYRAMADAVIAALPGVGLP